MKHRTLAATAAFAAYGALAAAPAEAATVKVAVIDPVSGPFGAIGENAIRSFRMGEEHYQRKNGKQDNSLEYRCVPSRPCRRASVFRHAAD